MIHLQRMGRDALPAFRFLATGTALYLLSSLPGVHRQLVVPFTEFGAWAWGGLLRALGENVIQAGTVVTDPGAGFSLRLLDGCNGLFASIILIAAVMAHRAGLAERGVGIVLGLIGIFLGNQIRLLGLFWIGRGARTWLEPAHVYVGPALMVLLALGIWFGWAEWVAHRRRKDVKHA